MRPASKALIASNLVALPPWEASLYARVGTVLGARQYVDLSLADVRARITAGDCTITTQALIRSINRIVADVEAGEITSIEAHGPGSFTLYRKGRD